MLRITIQLIPHGDESLTSTLGTIDIWNDLSHSDRADMGNYEGNLFSASPFFMSKTGKVKDFPRQEKSSWHLLAEFLKNTLD